MALPVFEIGNTVQFTWVSSVAPNGAPIFKVTEARSDSVIASISAIQSDTTHYYALYTMPGSAGYFTGEWFAQKTVSSSVYNFIKRFNFKADVTAAPD